MKHEHGGTPSTPSGSERSTPHTPPIPQFSANRAVHILSGGLDSTVLLYKIISEGFVPSVLSFDYGQRHSKELHYAELTCQKLSLPHMIVDLTSLQSLLRSTLTFDGPVPEGHYAAENMKATVVPNRNAIMLSIAYGYAVSIGAIAVFCGAHAGDHDIYPDCRQEFFDQLNVALKTGNEWASPPPTIRVPFLHVSKADIVCLGNNLNVPFYDTWSCYKGHDQHCGKCGTCVERREAFALAEVEDPQPFEDYNYWVGVTNAS